MIVGVKGKVEGGLKDCEGVEKGGHCKLRLILSTGPSLKELEQYSTHTDNIRQNA